MLRTTQRILFILERLLGFGGVGAPPHAWRVHLLSGTARPLSENTHAKLLRELGFDAVTHGFRSSFRDYAAEQTHTPHAVMEAALAHAVRNKAEAAYARSDLFENRRALMKT